MFERPQKLEDSLVTNDFVSSEILVENSSAPQLSSELEEVSSAMNSSVSEKAVTESSQTESTVETSKPELVEALSVVHLIMRRRLLRPLYRNRRCGRFGFPILAWI